MEIRKFTQNHNKCVYIFTRLYLHNDIQMSARARQDIHKHASTTACIHVKVRYTQVLIRLLRDKPACKSVFRKRRITGAQSGPGARDAIHDSGRAKVHGHNTTRFVLLRKLSCSFDVLKSLV